MQLAVRFGGFIYFARAYFPIQTPQTQVERVCGKIEQHSRAQIQVNVASCSLQPTAAEPALEKKSKRVIACEPLLGHSAVACLLVVPLQTAGNSQHYCNSNGASRAARAKQWPTPVRPPRERATNARAEPARRFGAKGNAAREKKSERRATNCVHSNRTVLLNGHLVRAIHTQHFPTHSYTSYMCDRARGLMGLQDLSQMIVNLNNKLARLQRRSSDCLRLSRDKTLVSQA